MRSISRRRRRPPRRRRGVVKAPHTIHLAHSPDADDAFMFWALAARPTDPRAALGAGSLLIAVPGELTTAYLALKLYQPAARHVVVPFDQIEEYVAAGQADAGLLIHEGQLTYADRGLHLWVDL